jgi:hypothetical protein
MRSLKTHLFLFLCLYAMSGLLNNVRAQEPNFGITATHVILEKDTLDGDIIALNDGRDKFIRANKPGDPKLYGVVFDNAPIIYRSIASESARPVARSGQIFVNMTTLGGDIKIGDYLTSSPVIGAGQKATDLSGYMIGVALGSFGSKDGKEVTYQGKKYRVGKLKVAVGIGPASPIQNKTAGGLLGTVQQATINIMTSIKSVRDLEKIIRYILAVIIAAIAIYVSYRSFGQNITKGIEGIGRNPLAKVSIQSMIILNVVLLVIVALGGIILSLVIISL